jgi:hypothetical protein
MSNKNTLRITGRIIDRTTHNGIAGLRVEAWDKDLVLDDLVGSAVTEAEGRFEIEFSESYFSEKVFDRSPDLFFKVFAGDTLIKSTSDSVLWNVREGNIPVEIAIVAPGPSSEPGGNSENVDYVVSGAVASPKRAGGGDRGALEKGGLTGAERSLTVNGAVRVQRAHVERYVAR